MATVQWLKYVIDSIYLSTTHTCVYACVCTCVSICINVYMCACQHVNYAFWQCVCSYACMVVSLFVSTHTYSNISIWNLLHILAVLLMTCNSNFLVVLLLVLWITDSHDFVMRSLVTQSHAAIITVRNCKLYSSGVNIRKFLISLV